jgi:uncharacterized protein (DUF433 family)
MATELIHDRGRGPELIGTRITVYNLFDYFLDPTATEDYICKLYDLTPEQVAAMRAYVLNHPDEVLAQHLKIEARIAEGNPPEVREEAKRTHETFMRFKAWLEEQKRADEEEEAKNRAAGIETADTPAHLRTFREWVIEQKSRPVEGP